MFSHHTQDKTLGSSLWSAEVWVPCPFFPALFTPCRSFLPTVSTHIALLYFFVRSLAEMFFLQKLPGLSLCVAEDSAQISRPERDPPWLQCLKLTFLFLVYKVFLVNTLFIFLIVPFTTWNSFSDILCFSPPLHITLLYKGPFILYHHPPLSSVSGM